MCVNYLPVPKRVLQDFFKVLPPDDEWAGEVWQDYVAPIIVGHEQSRVAVLAELQRYRVCANLPAQLSRRISASYPGTAQTRTTADRRSVLKRDYGLDNATMVSVAGGWGAINTRRRGLKFDP